MIRSSFDTRRAFAALTLVLGLFVSVPAGFAASGTADARAVKLDQLFETLSHATSAEEGEATTSAIWETWLEYGDPRIDAYMRNVVVAMNRQRFEIALEMLDKIVEEVPDHSEAWNKRATVNYMVQRFDQSLEDIEKTLALEPRHFGALSGKALILTARGEKEAALEAIEQALKIHPFLKGARAIIERNGGTYRPQRGI
ncbi:MAG: tetratricopeptide repeat protein [Hyphomicrobiaceae bacterium]